MTYKLPDKVKAWLAQPMPADVRRAVERIARASDVRHVAIMPDVHLARDVCVGTVVATTDLIYPAAVGSDIGCGIAAIAFDADATLIGRERSSDCSTGLQPRCRSIATAAPPFRASLPSDRSATASWSRFVAMTARFNLGRWVAETIFWSSRRTMTGDCG
jgi:tRNA-splicing ligase RtcB